MKTNYSIETSLPAFEENRRGKMIQTERIIGLFKSFGGKACLKQIEILMGLPASTCAGRINDLINDGKVIHQGYVQYEGRKRKLFLLLSPEVKQQSLFAL